MCLFIAQCRIESLHSSGHRMVRKLIKPFKYRPMEFRLVAAMELEV